MRTKPKKFALHKAWSDFLEEVDDQLEETVSVVCIGGFVVGEIYGVPRTTADLDYIEIEPDCAYDVLERIAGLKSKLAKKHRLYFQRVDGIADYPEGYKKRLIKLDLGLSKLQLSMLDPYDLILSKLTRNLPRDREDVKAVVKAKKLKFDVLERRYKEEVRPYLLNERITGWADDVIQKLWKEFFSH